VVYTNSIDHAFDLKKVVSEVRRVLINKGKAFIEISTSDRLKNKKHLESNNWESLIWESYDDVIELFKVDFNLLNRSISYDNNFVCCFFQKKDMQTGR
jgi:hypothetical protein